MLRKSFGFTRIFQSMLVFIIITTTLASSQEKLRFSEKAVWIQIGNQIKDINDEMLDLISECGFGKVILLHSSVNEKGYFPVMKSIVRRCHKKGIKVSIGTLVFKDTYQKSYWERHPELRKSNKDGSYAENKYYHYQICPDNPRNHEYAASLLLRSANESFADEVHIDYESSPCYCSYCIKDFEEKYGKDARKVDPKDSDWLIWRSRKTKDFMEVLARKNYSNYPDFKISFTAPVIGLPGGFTAYETDLRYEDMTQYVNEFIPMIYLSKKQSPTLAGEKYSSIKRRLMGKIVTPGLILNEEGTQEIKSGDRIMSEFRSVLESGADSIGIFEVRYITGEIKDVLKNI